MLYVDHHTAIVRTYFHMIIDGSIYEKMFYVHYNTFNILHQDLMQVVRLC